MKILLINKFHYIKGGSETYYFALANALKKRGHDVIFYSMKDDKNVPTVYSKYFVSNIDYSNAKLLDKVRLGKKFIYSYEAKNNLIDLIKTEKPDIAHLNLVHHQLSLSIIDALKQYRIPIVFTVHDLSCICPNYLMYNHGKICEACIDKNFFQCIKNRCVKNSLSKSILSSMQAIFDTKRNVYNDIHMYITPSEFYKNKLLQAKFTKSPILYMKNFLSDDFVYEKCTPKEKYFLYFARLSKEKGILTLIEAIKRLKDDKNKVFLKIIGSGPLETMILEKIKNENIDNIEMLGFLTGDKLSNIIKNSYAVILPSEWYENGPYTIMEAMGKGKIAIVSDKGGLPELIHDNENGYIFESGNVDSLIDRIRKVNNLDQNTYQKMCDNAFHIAKKEFNSDNYSKQLITYYEDILNNTNK